MAEPAPAVERDHAPGLERLFSLDEVEGAGPTRLLAGALPAELAGTVYWNGPGARGRGEVRYRHWLDGDGLVAALRLGGAEAPVFTSRFVRSRKRVEEEAAGAALFRTFGTRFANARLQGGLALASPVNVSVFPFAGNLLAFGEQGLPWALDPATLATRGEHTFGGALNAVSPFSAHPAYDRASGEMYAFGVSFAPAEPLVHLYRFGVDGRLQRRARLPLPYACSIHDFGLSAGHALLYASPYLLDAEALLRTGRTVQESLAWRPELGSRLLVARRGDFGRVGEVSLGERYCLHWINAFEDDGALVADVVELERPVYDQYEVLPDLFRGVAPGRPVRLRIDRATLAVRERRELAYDRAPDFPVVAAADAGAPYRRFWMLGISATGQPGRKFFDELVALDWETDRSAIFRAPAGVYFASEPVHVPTPGSGALCILAFDAQRNVSEAWVFDAGAVDAGPRARLSLPYPVPALFHGAWSPAANGLDSR
jgi:carotenoid cleavage dioxygenase-like enzyme